MALMIRTTTLAWITLLLAANLAVCQTAVTEKERSSVPDKINEGFLDPDLDPQDWIDRFEVESREVFVQRKVVVDAVKLEAGQSVADVGAGTGLFLPLLSEAVGTAGKVHAIDISPRLIKHLKERVDDEGLSNVNVVLSKEDSITLPNDSVDIVFVCATYHHFEYHADMLLSVRNALRRGGQLVVVDFERIPGESREWILGHVRAGKEEVKKEIQRSGFRFIEEVEIPGLEENYFLRFQRP
jgi:ubiquinone/menaquinone biosynthesis C-methylase UbiE